MRLFNEIMVLLDQIEPMRSPNNYKRIWVSECRGTIDDMLFDDLEEAMDYFDVESEADLQKKFLNWYSEERYWFMLEAMHNEECRFLRFTHFTICIHNKMPEHIDSTEHEYSRFLQWTKDALSIAISQAETGKYIAEKELPYNYRYGTISRKKLYECRPSYKEDTLKDLTDEEINRFIQIIKQEENNGIPEGRIKEMTFNMYFEYVSKAFSAAGFDIKGMTPYEQFKRYGEDFGGGILKNISHDTTDGFLYYYDDRHHMGGHPWGIVRGSSRTRIYLWPQQTDEGFYFKFSGNEIFMAYEMVKMYLALKDSGMPVYYSGSREDIIRYLRQDDMIGIVPSFEIALYHQHEFPNQDIDDFMHFYPDKDADIADLIEWQPIMPIIFKREK